MKYEAQVRNSRRSGKWVLSQPLVYRDIVVPTGFITDGASIPWGFQWLLKKGGPLFPCAVVHDYLYCCANIPRKEADQIFLEMMLENEVSRWKAYLMYGAVRIFGGLFYGRSKRERTG